MDAAPLGWRQSAGSATTTGPRPAGRPAPTHPEQGGPGQRRSVSWAGLPPAAPVALTDQWHGGRDVVISGPVPGRVPECRRDTPPRRLRARLDLPEVRKISAPPDS